MTPIFVAQAGAQPHPLISVFPFILMFVIFYFLLIRPQQKQQKEHRRFTQELSKNQEVVTSGGIHGTIVQVKDSSVLLRIADNVKMEIEKASIARPRKSAAEGTKS